jgi:amino acid transporter
MAHTLQKNALNLAHSVVMGVAGTAPSFSISATMATLIGAVGILAPASLLYCGILMFGITFAYMHLNREEANAGASYAWVSRVFNRTLGFFAGWTLLVASALFMVSATIPAGNATLLLLRPDLVDNHVVVTFVSLGWLVLISAIVIRGIALTAAVQTVMTVIEIAILGIVIVAAAVKFGPNAMHALSWADLSPAAFDPSSFASGAVIALFFFWGWDVAVNLTEETRDSARAPGLGAVVAMIIITAAFTAFSAIVLMTLGDEEISQSSTNVIFGVADKLFPRPWSYIAVLALMLSTIGTLETSILQFTRTMFAKSRDGVLHRRWAHVHHAWRTPYAATLLIAGLGCALLLLSLLFRDVGAVLKASINAIGVQAAYYYGLAGLACAWHFRQRARKSPGALLLMVVWPALSAIVLWIAAAIAISEFDTLTAMIAIGGVLLGFIPLTARRRDTAPPRRD